MGSLGIELANMRNEKLTEEEIDALIENKKRAERLSGEFKPAIIKTKKAVLVGGDFHIPFHDRVLIKKMYKVADEYGIDTLLVPGDFWDCDSYKNTEKMINLTYLETFKSEKEHVIAVLEDLVGKFKSLYFCRGNHEKRWLKYNLGMVGIDELFAITQVKGNYKVSLDDYMALYQGNSKWYIGHPNNYSPSQLSVATRLADKYPDCNIFCAHGHMMAQGHDKTGEHQLVDGAGLFDSDQIEYLRNTTTFPSVFSGFYVIMDGRAHPFEGRGRSRII